MTNTPGQIARFFFVRHGETAWSLNRQHTGRSDLTLTAHGEQEVRQLREVLRDVKIDRVFCSPRLRARQTCQLLGWDATMEIEPDLAEWDYGDYEGLRSVDIRKNRPDWNLFLDGCPRGETPAEVSSRADRLIARFRTLHGDIAICSHGDFGRVLGARWIRLPVEWAQHLLLGTASVSILGHDHGRIDEPALACWNAGRVVLG